MCYRLQYLTALIVGAILLPNAYSRHFNISEENVEIITNATSIQILKDALAQHGERLSPDCFDHVTYYLKKLFIHKKKDWALQMFDAGSKIPSGILTGNLADLGTFDECMKIDTLISQTRMRGKYCLGHIPIPDNIPSRALSPDMKLSIMFATCLPDSCSTQDIERLYSILKAKFSNTCQSESSQLKLDSGAIITITFLTIILAIVVISTAYDCYLWYTKRETSYILLIAFSALTNGRKLFSVGLASNQISCLHGIRVISMMWIILGHRYAAINQIPMRNPMFLIEWMDNYSNMYIMNASLAVDTFLVLSGIVVAYGFMSAVARGTKFNIPLFYIHRYLRLTPVLAVIVLLYATLLIHLGSGPYWPTNIGLLTKPCKVRWWHNLLYVQNYVINYKGSLAVCLGQSWYLAMDMHLYILSPLILIPIKRWPKFGLALTGMFGLASMLASALVGWFYELRGFNMANATLDYMLKYYYATHTRATPWLMGIICGYYIFKIKQGTLRISINKFAALLSWVIALGILAACIFTGYDTADSPYDRLGNAFYISLLRPGWSVGVILVILLCELKCGGPVNWFLSAPLFQVLSRLTYTMYLLHMGIQIVVEFRLRDISYVSNLTVMYQYLGDYVLTAAVAVLFTLAFESPIITIEKVVFGGTKNTKKSNQSRLE